MDSSLKIANPSENIICPSVKSVPSSRTLFARSQLHFGFTVTPFCPVDVTTLNPKTFGILRCTNCRCYYSPFCLANRAQKSWVCSICYSVNSLPTAFVFEAEEVPKTAVFDLIAPEEYIYKPLQIPTFVFLIDISTPSLLEQTALLDVLERTLLQLRNQNKLPKNTRVGFLFFSVAVVFACVDEHGRVILQTSCETNSTPFVSEEVSVLFDLFAENGEAVLIDVFAAARELVSLNISATSCLEHAIECAEAVLEEDGGRLFLFQMTVPLVKNPYERADMKSKLTSSPEKSGLIHKLFSLSITEKKQLKFDLSSQSFLSRFRSTTQSSQKEVAEACRKLSTRLLHDEAALDLFVCTPDITFFPEIAELTRFGGRSHFLPATAERFAAVLQERLTACVYWQACMKIRMNAVHSLKALFGNMFFSQEYVTFPLVDSNTSFGFEFSQTASDDKWAELSRDQEKKLRAAETVSSAAKVLSNHFFFQTSILHTDSSGTRKIRVINVALPVCVSPTQLFEELEVGTYFALLLKRAAAKYKTTGAAKGRAFVQDSCKALVRNYRRVTSSFNSLKTLVEYPANLTKLPLLTLAALKCRAFSAEEEEQCDRRHYWLERVMLASVQETVALLEPQLFDLDLGIQKRLTVADLRPRSVHAVSDIAGILIRIGLGAGELVQKLFGLTEEQLNKFGEAELSTLLQARLKEVATGTLINKPLTMLAELNGSLDVCIESRSSDQAFVRLLFEDKTDSVMSLQDFVDYLGLP